MIFGKLIGGFIGYLVGGIGFAIAGVIVGHIFDSGYSRARVRLHPSPEQLQKIQHCFFTTVFTLLGHLAKADGRISEEEIKQTENFMGQMGLTAEHRREAIRLFQEGARPDFDPDATVREFKAVCGRQPNLVRMLLVYLLNVAMADGKIDAAEEAVLRRIARGLGIATTLFDQLIRMMRAQDSFSSQSGYSGASAQPSPNQLEMAYQALGVSSTASDAQIKKAYRKLMSQYHPDKLTGQGMPEDMVKSATERSQEIQMAYDLIKKSRGN